MPTKPRTVRELWEGPDLGRADTPLDTLVTRLLKEIGDALIIPLADGQQVVVVEKAVLGNAADVLDGIVDDIVNDRGSGGDVTNEDVVAILSALFPAGIEVAEAVGVANACGSRRDLFGAAWLEMSEEVAPGLGGKVDIVGRRVALVEEKS